MASVKMGLKVAPSDAGQLAFTERKVGPGCANTFWDVKTVQQLLKAAGESPGAADGYWSDKPKGATKNALQSFMNKYGSPEQRRTNVLEPNDGLLLRMAQLGKLIIPLSGKKGIDGVKETHRWLRNQGIKYNKGADKTPYQGDGRALWGVQGTRGCIIQVRQGGFEHASPIELECTLYVNLMVSVYLYGDAHTNYNAHTGAATSEDKHLCQEFYAFPLLTRGSLHYFMSEEKKGTLSEAATRTAAQITEATSAAPSSLYVIEVGGAAQGRMSHMALLQDSRVYECTTGQTGSACIDSPLETFVARVFTTKAHKVPLYIFGPK